MRRRRSELLGQAALTDLGYEESVSTDNLAANETSAAVRAAVTRLPADQQRALELANAACEASGSLAAMDSDNLLWQSYHAGALTTRARLRAEGARPWPDAAAASEFEAQRERMLKLALRAPGSTFVVLAAADAQRLAGDLVRDDEEIAAGHWRRGLDLLPPTAEQRTPDEQFMAFALRLDGPTRPERPPSARRHGLSASSGSAGVTVTITL
jgi:hypothetical protein